MIVGLFATVQSFGQSGGGGTATDKYPSLKSQAQALSDAVVNRDFEKLVGCSHPTLVEYLGGREKMIADIKKVFEDSFDKQGVKLLGFRYPGVEQEVKIDNEIFVVVTEIVQMQIRETKYEGDGSEVAISADGGKNWKFVSGTTGQMMFDRLFPKASGKIKLRDVGAPRKVE